jgi:hypothetical protein
MAPLRLMLDSNVSHALRDDEDLWDALRVAVIDRRFEVLVTHVQVDENLNHPDPEQGRGLIHFLMSVGARSVPTHGLVLGVSRIGFARLFSDEDVALFERFRLDNPRHSRDGLIAMSAWREGAVLVTAERMRERFRIFDGLRVWSIADLRRELNLGP